MDFTTCRTLPAIAACVLPCVRRRRHSAYRRLPGYVPALIPPAYAAACQRCLLLPPPFITYRLPCCCRFCTAFARTCRLPLPTLAFQQQRGQRAPAVHAPCLISERLPRRLNRAAADAVLFAAAAVPRRTAPRGRFAPAAAAPADLGYQQRNAARAAL